MRKLLALLVLVPFAAVLVLSCDEHPTAPEDARAATIVQESSAPLAAQPPALPIGVTLSSWTLVEETVVIPDSDVGSVFAACPAGMAPVTGGFECETSYELLANRPAMQNGKAGWYAFIYNLGEGTDQDLTAYAACVSVATVE
jgi:hypothetical protein